ERARAGVGDRALQGPARDRHDVEQLTRDGAKPEAGGQRGEDLRHALARVADDPVGLLDPQQHPHLVQREHGQVGAGDEHGPADDERPPVLRRGLQLLDQSAEHRETDGQAHQRRRVERAARPRAWIASRTPTAARFAIIDEPPTLTNGSGMPVIGAIPIVIPTLTKIWKSSATTMPPATTAE